VAVLLLAACFCGRQERDPVIAPGRVSPASGEAARRLLALIPAESRCGEIFQRQPDGRAAIAVLGTGFTRADVVSWGGRPLDTTYGSSRLLTASLSPELLARAGEVPVSVASSVDATVPALKAAFRVRPPCGEVPTPRAK
jgi:hypothetical protein